DRLCQTADLIVMTPSRRGWIVLLGIATALGMLTSGAGDGRRASESTGLLDQLAQALFLSSSHKRTEVRIVRRLARAQCLFDAGPSAACVFISRLLTQQLLQFCRRVETTSAVFPWAHACKLPQHFFPLARPSPARGRARGKKCC